jgi:tetratricopeptide (TPR) repeat protein
VNDFALRRKFSSLRWPNVNAFLQKILLPLFLAGALAGAGAVKAAQADAADVPATAAPDTNALLLRSVLLLQEQLRTTQRAVEQAKEEAQAESKRNAEAMAARLKQIEQTLDSQRQQQIESLQRTTRTMLTVVGVITGVGFLAVLFAGVIQVRTMTRLADVSRQFQALLPPPRTGGGPALLPGPEAMVQPDGSNLLSAIDRLQKRLEDVESTAGGTHTATNGHKPLSVTAAGSAQITALLAKGQSLLNGNQPAEALEQIEHALHLDPKNAEALIKKGSALEKLQRIDEAIAAYDEAIALDNTQATAYLFKAGVFNRQKKYAEALQCYEKALSVQQKARGTQAAKA